MSLLPSSPKIITSAPQLPENKSQFSPDPLNPSGHIIASWWNLSHSMEERSRVKNDTKQECVTEIKKKTKKNMLLTFQMPFVYILTDFKNATLTPLYIFQDTVVCKTPLLRWCQPKLASSENTLVLIVQLNWTTLFAPYEFRNLNIS